MANDTVTLELLGEVAIDELSSAIVHLRGLLSEISREVAGGTQIAWMVNALEAGSALTAFRGVPISGEADRAVEDVVRAYGRVGTSLMQGDRTGLSDRVQVEALALVGIINGRVRSIRFETAEVEAVVSTSPEALPPPRQLHTALGAVEGRVQTLSSRGGLRFTLYDTLHDRAVSCYLSEDFDRERLRDAWGHRAFVEGRVTRDPLTGQPRSVRQVTNVTVRQPADYRRAGGAMAGAWNDSAGPAEAIRRLRDA